MYRALPDGRAPYMTGRSPVDPLLLLPAFGPSYRLDESECERKRESESEDESENESESEGVCVYVCVCVSMSVCARVNGSACHLWLLAGVGPAFSP
jgi:hypothetical protein